MKDKPDMAEKQTKVENEARGSDVFRKSGLPRTLPITPGFNSAVGLFMFPTPKERLANQDEQF